MLYAFVSPVNSSNTSDALRQPVLVERYIDGRRELVVTDEDGGDVGIERGRVAQHAERARRHPVLVVLSYNFV